MEVEIVEAVADRVMKRAEDAIGVRLDRYRARKHGVGVAVQMVDGQNGLYEAWGCVVGRIFKFSVCFVTGDFEVRGSKVFGAEVIATDLFVAV